MATEIRPLEPQQRAVAEKELGENEKRRAKDLRHIREWLDKQPHISARTDDQWLVTFLRGCKFSLERTKHKLDTYYSVRSAAPEFFSGRSPLEPSIQAILDAGYITDLPRVDAEGRRVTVVRLGRLEPRAVSADDLFRLMFMCGDRQLAEDDAAVVCGIAALIDLHGCSLAYAAMFSPALVRKSMTILQEAYPFRLKALHFVNAPSVYEAISGLFLSFMKDKLRRRVMVHSSLESLHKHFSRDILPEEYGGTVGSLQDITAVWRRQLEERADWFREEEAYKTDESLRPGKPRNRSALFGVEGSFRQLETD